jgi:hypothetical protein
MAVIDALRRLFMGPDAPAPAAPPEARVADDRPSPAMHRKLLENMEILGKGYGQLRTFESHRPMDAEGRPLPWFTYPAIEYLKRIDCAGWRVFEYGSGQSTSYWAGRGASVTSVEHNPTWFQEMTQHAPQGATILHRTERGAYANAIAGHGDAFNIVVVDGVWRDSCADACLPYLAPDGMLILDNSDWYWETAARLRSKGLFEVSFSGFGPVNDYTWTTSIFFRGMEARMRDMSAPEPVGGLRLGPEARDEWW